MTLSETSPRSASAPKADRSDALVLDGVTKTYGPVVALRDVSLRVRRGEIHALLGENGAGKSTLMAVTAGVTKADRGTVELVGHDVGHRSPQEIKELGLAVVYQHPALLPDLTVAENLLLAVPASTKPPVRRASRWAAEILDSYGLSVDPSMRLDELGLAERHMLEIAKALASDPSVLVLDEPTEPLSEQQTDQLFDRIRDVAAHGTAVVYISHRLQDVRRISDRMTVLRDGQSQGTFDTGELSEDDILRLIVGRPVSAAFPPKLHNSRAETQLSVKQLSGHGFADISVHVAAGEIVGLAGIEGNGQRDFIRALAGASQSRGDIRIGSQRLERSNPGDAVDLGVIYVSGDRQTEGLLPDLSVRENVTLQSLRRYSVAGWISDRKERSAVQAQQDRLGIRMATQDVPIRSLSGGNQQKAMFARAMLAEPTVLLADEPTQGVDAGARLDIYGEIRRVADAGAAVVLLSSDAVELRGLCDRVLVFSRGRVVRELIGSDVTEANITHASLTSNSTRDSTTDGTSRRAAISARRIASGDYAPAILLGLIAVAVGVYTATQNDRYLTEANFTSYLYLTAILGLVSLAQSIVVMTGGIDLSVGPLIGFVTVIASYIMTSDSTVALLATIVVLLLAAAGVGLINGILVQKVRITPVIATLVTFFALQGINLLIRETSGGRISARFADIAKTDIWFIPLAFVGVGLLVVVFELALRFTKWGVRLRAVGSDEASAHRVGVNTGRVVLGAYVTGAVLTGVAGLLFLALIEVGDPGGGRSYTLSSIAVVVLGGAAITGGRGSFLGVLAGAVIVQQAANVTTFLRLNSEWQFWFVGLLTLGAASLYSLARRTQPT